MSLTRAGIFAAGDGLRLRGKKEGGGPIKPMALVGDRPLCHWVVSGLAHAGITRMAFLTNSRGQEAQKSLAQSFPGLEWTFLTQDTASSWESFCLVASRLAAAREPFVMSTVDALVPPAEVKRFLAQASLELARARAALALTEFIDDEKPLWADMGGEGLITAMGENASAKRYATAGLYALSPEFARRLPSAARYSSLRSFWIRAAADKAAIAGVKLAKTLDVDRPEDLSQAQDFVRGFAERGAQGLGAEARP